MTRSDHASGSDRIFEALGLLDPLGTVDIVVNVQGDLPTVEPSVIAAALRPLADASNLSLRNEIPEGLTALADASMLSLIFQNLISNAIDYTPGGVVIVGAGAGGGSAVECWVSDNGSGIPAERQEKVFDKLETDPVDKGGMGLGLAIVRQFVEAHGGRVSVESEVGRGSTFRFTIPSGAG